MRNPPLLIHEIDPTIAAFHNVWKRNRDMIEGERAIKAAGRVYLPQDAGVDDDQHRNIITRTPFFPGAARTHEGLMGLIFRKSATVTAPDSVADILETITADGYNLDDLAEDVVSELMITNFVALVTDYPIAPAGMTKAQAIDLGFRPYIAIFQAESILGIETAAINNRLRVTRVRLQEDDETIRELSLKDNVYTVTIWRANGGHWNATDTYTPTKAGKVINEIPFSLVTSNRKYAPAKAKLADVCDVNAQHYIASANLALSDFWVSHPTPYIFGVEVGELNLSPGSFITAKGKANDIRVGMLEYTGSAISQLAARVSTLSDDMAKVGSRILAAEKNAVESAEGQAIKTASENAALASTARLATRWINDQLKWVSYWLDLPEDAITYQLNTDYGVAKLTKEECDFLFAQYQSGVISRDTYIDALIAGDVLPETYDSEADADKIAQEIADRPPVIGDEPSSNLIDE